MYKIKQTLEDFVVKEIIDLKFNNKGDYSYYKLIKHNYTTLKALEIITRKFHIKQKYINFAGTKDKKAVVEQYVSILNGPKRNIISKGIELRYIGRGNTRLNLGSLVRNSFIITLRNLDKKDIINLLKNIIKKGSLRSVYINDLNNKIEEIILPNYFGEQRFSKNNHLIGKLIIKKDFKSAIKLILENKGDYESKVKDYINKNKNDYIGALRQINKRILQLYIHSYQSYLWNKTIKRLTKKKFNIKVPIIGFGSEIKNKEIKEIIEDILKKENIDYKDFIIKEIPELSSEGSKRDLFVKIKDFKINKIIKDELNKNKLKVIISFSLPKGSYATVVVDELLK
jgi:tRNA pseudouridine13 synthase